jgi:hypothetical protein
VTRQSDSDISGDRTVAAAKRAKGPSRPCVCTATWPASDICVSMTATWVLRTAAIWSTCCARIRSLLFALTADASQASPRVTIRTTAATATPSRRGPRDERPASFSSGTAGIAGRAATCGRTAGGVDGPAASTRAQTTLRPSSTLVQPCAPDSFATR